MLDTSGCGSIKPKFQAHLSGGSIETGGGAYLIKKGRWYQFSIKTYNTKNVQSGEVQVHVQEGWSLGDHAAEDQNQMRTSSW